MLGCAVVGALLVWGVEGRAEVQVSFARDVRPIFNKHCVSCHGGVKRAGEISYTRPETVIARKPEEKKPIHPGKPEASELMRRITSKDPEKRMPPPSHGGALEADQIETLRRWIAQGGSWEAHWSFVPPKDPGLPAPKGAHWARNGLDRFILARLETEGLAPSPPAARAVWLRRVSLDLIGLPPSLEEQQEFEADPSDLAFEKAVDRLLASPAFGERWASVWLDLARYADSTGFEKDPARTIWPWRDWVIRALNQNMPFDQFTLRQLAGDLLPEATLDDYVATAFHRNTQNNTEGGTDDEEYRIAAVLDRVNTTFEAWQGVTFKCTQCHAHPYEPIEHREYYEVYSIFNQTQDWDLREEYPLLRAPVERTNFASAAVMDRAIFRLRRAEFEAGAELKRQDQQQWQTLRPLKAGSTHGTRLAIRPDGEIRTEGTVAHFSRFTLEMELPAAPAPLTAFRLEAMPLDPEKARFTPEMGFVVSRIRVAIIATNQPFESVEAGKPLLGEIALAQAFGDEAQPFRDCATVLGGEKGGWGPLPRMMGPRTLVVVPAEPVRVDPGFRLAVILYHDEGPGDFAALVMKRFRLDASTNPAWTAMVQSAESKERKQELTRLVKERVAISAVEMPFMVEVEPQFHRATAVFVRGNWLDKGPEVTAAVPRIFAQLPTNRPPDRLAFAQWLMSADNPLTARVTVNRFWEQLFGCGIVETLEDFGSSGQPPVNQDLLDHLAVRFQRDLHWDVKALLREMVLSAAYRQDAHVTADKLAKDPRNRLVSRGPRTRLSAEMVRDQALCLSGLLSGKMYGPPVMPPQPDGIWRAAYSSEKWTTSTGEDRFRRAVYTYVRRTAGYPSFQTFDTPSRDICTARRLRTNTPLQALVTLNDPVYLEASAAFGKRMRTEGGASAVERIRWGLEMATGVKSTSGDVEDLLELYEQALSSVVEAAKDSAHPAEPPEVYALSTVASAILNLDAVLTR